MEMQKSIENIEFCIDDLGYLGEPLEVRAIVMSKILKEMNLRYKRYYISKSRKSFKRVKRPDVEPKDMSIAFTVTCNKNYLDFAKYRYVNRMNTILQLQRAFMSPDTSSDV